MEESRIGVPEEILGVPENHGTVDPEHDIDINPLLYCQGRGGKAESVNGYQTVLSYVHQITGNSKPWMSEKWLSSAIDGRGLRCDHWGRPVVVFKPYIVEWALKGFPKYENAWTLRQIIEWVCLRHQMNSRTATRLVESVIKDMGIKPISYPIGRIPGSIQTRISFPTYRSEDYRYCLENGPHQEAVTINREVENPTWNPFTDDDGEQPVYQYREDVIPVLEPELLQQWGRRVQPLVDALPPFTAQGIEYTGQPSEEGSKISIWMEDGSWPIHDPFRLKMSDEEFAAARPVAMHIPWEGGDWAEEWGEEDRETLGD